MTLAANAEIVSVARVVPRSQWQSMILAFIPLVTRFNQLTQQAWKPMVPMLQSTMTVKMIDLLFHLLLLHL